jgi:hypothetical protein
MSKITRAKWTAGVVQSRAPTLQKALSSNPVPIHPPKKNKMEVYKTKTEK